MQKVICALIWEYHLLIHFFPAGNDSRGKSPPPPGSDNTNNPSDQGSLYPTEMNGLAAQLRHNYTITQHG